jgi:hypothetical protein
LVPVVATAAAHVLFALAADGVILGVGLVFFISLGRDHVLEVGDGAGAVSAEVFEGATLVETVLEEDEDFFVRDINYCGALVEEAAHVLAKGLALLLLHHGQVHASTERPIAPAKLLVNFSFSWSHLSIEYFSSDSSHVSGAWSRQKGK